MSLSFFLRITTRYLVDSQIFKWKKALINICKDKEIAFCSHTQAQISSKNLNVKILQKKLEFTQAIQQCLELEVIYIYLMIAIRIATTTAT